MFEDYTDTQKKIFESLVSQDDNRAKFSWSIEIQQQILGMICCDKYFTVQCLDLVKPHYFEEKPHEIICDTVFGYFKKYAELPPKSILHEVMNDRLANNKSRSYFLAELDVVTDTYEPALDVREFLLEKVTFFAKRQALKRAFYESFNVITSGGNAQEAIWSKVDVIIRDALKVERNTDIGLNYFETLEERYERMRHMEEKQEIFTSGFGTIDAALLGGGLRRGEIAAWMGTPGSGKSLALVKGVVQNLKNNKKALYVSLEMDQDRLAQRFDSQIACVNVRELINRNDEVSDGIANFINHHQDKRRLYIKQFPAGTADVNTIRAYMAQLQLHGFVPDILFVDYIGEMKNYPGMSLWEGRERIVRDLRGFGQENKHCTITAIQPNRSARQAQEEGVVDDEHMGDSSGQLRPLDALWTINQRQVEREACVGRIWVAKHRNGKSRFWFDIHFDYDHLTMNEVSHEEYLNRLSMVKDSTSNKVANFFKDKFSKKSSEE